MMVASEIKTILNSFSPIGLDGMDNVRLMDRIDTKYVLSVKRIPELLLSIDERYRALEINDIKVFSYSTTYLDSSDFMFYNEHITGRPERYKVRYRKYEATGASYLEVKKKTRKNRTIKWRIESNMTSDNRYDIDAAEFINEYIPQKQIVLNPVIRNNFKRITLVGSEIAERITIDWDLSFSGKDGRHIDFPYLAIIELKRQGFSDRSPVADILKSYLVRPTGFSKYCFGNGILNDVSRKNLIKPKVLLLNRIENEYNRSVVA
jgi:hypothetical protein